MHIRPIPLGLTILGFGLLIGPTNEAFYRFIVRDPTWLLRDPVGWKEHLKQEIRGVIIRGIIGLTALTAGIIGLIV